MRAVWAGVVGVLSCALACSSGGGPEDPVEAGAPGVALALERAGTAAAREQRRALRAFDAPLHPMVARTLSGAGAAAALLEVTRGRQPSPSGLLRQPAPSAAVEASAPSGAVTWVSPIESTEAPERWRLRMNGWSAYFGPEGMTLGLRGSGGAGPAGWGLRARVPAAAGSLVAERPLASALRRIGGGAATVTNPSARGRVAWEELRPGMDLVAEPAPGGMAYRFVLSPGARVEDATLEWEGATGLTVVEDGRGVDVETGVGVLRIRGLHAFALEPEGRRELPARHVVEGARVGVAVEGWSGAVPLVIDPVVSWSTYLGGSAVDATNDMAVDASGSVYLTGFTASAGFPVTAGLDTSISGPSDAFITKLTSAGALSWSTFVGGTGDDEAQAITVDATGTLVVGSTTSSDFPSPGGFDTTYAGNRDGFMARLDGSGVLLWGSFLGGSGEDQPRAAASDGSGGWWIAGDTSSTDFPVSGGYDTTFNGGRDAFAVHVTSGPSFAVGTYVGGGSADFCYGVVESGGSVYLAGTTSSPDFPTPGGFQSVTAGADEAFIVKTTGSALTWSSYLGGNSEDNGDGLAWLANGDVLVVGNTVSNNFPTTVGLTEFSAGGRDATLTRISPSGSIVWSTLYGGPQEDFALGAAEDADGNLYAVGVTRGGGLPSPGGFDSTFAGLMDAFVARFQGDGRVVWSSYVGGSDDDYLRRARVDTTGAVLVVGGTKSTDLGVANGFDVTYGSPAQDGLVLKVTYLADGSPCASDSVCQSDHCVDGVCCDTACAGACEACTSMWTGVAADGVCAPVRAGTDPGMECTPQSCSGGLVTLVAGCDGAGACEAPGTVSCGLYQCNGTSCGVSCSTDPDCVAGAHCTAGACTPDLPLGAPCSAPNECANGHCADGVCCNAACTGTCEACTAALVGSGTDGTCAPIGDGTDPGSECTPGSCSLGTATRAQVCNGARACRSDGTVPCGLYLCSGATCGTTCATDVDCAASAFCSSGACVADLARGAPCATASQCVSGSCTDGVCCDRPCDGTCEACTAVLTGGTTDGVCAPIATGTDPDLECTPASCAGSVVVLASVCDGGAACRASGTTLCAPYGCSAGACVTACATDADCDIGAHCSGTACVVDLAQGAACTAANECASGFCADGVCCDQACTGPCQACTAAARGTGSDGTCGDVQDGTDPRDRCPVGNNFPASCGPDGLCGASGACRQFAPPGTQCGAPACNGTSVATQTCNGAGSCQSGSVACAPFDCSGGACRTACTTGADCAAGAYCDSGGACVAERPRGSTCTDDVECATGACVDGFCCESSCAGGCEACDVAGSEGRCVAVQDGAPHGARPACAGDVAVCGGTCNGTARDCVYPPATRACGSTCAQGRETPSTCDGQGACVTGTAQSCSPYVCADATVCATSCTTTTGCAPGFACDGSACVPPVVAVACSADGASSVREGVVIPCAPYRCDPSSGSCAAICSTTADCTAGSVCDPGARACVTATPSAAAEEGGCGCRAAPQPASAGGPLAALLGALLVRRSRAQGTHQAARPRRARLGAATP